MSTGKKIGFTTTQCNDCERDLPSSTFFTEINPEGGYGRKRFIACDDCMRSGRWDDWKSRHWQNWPEPTELGAGVSSKGATDEEGMAGG